LATGRSSALARHGSRIIGVAGFSGLRFQPRVKTSDDVAVSRLLRGSKDARPRLKDLIKRGAPILAPGAYDALSARLVEEAGFPAVYMTGFGSSAGYLGRPDVGLMTMSEMVDNARRVAAAVNIPVIADADTGYGNPINVVRTVAEFEHAGVSAIHLEDQVDPKKCGHMDDKRVIAAEEMAAKIRAAVDTRSSEDFLIIARTDARAIEGLDAALARASKYREAGADVLFVEAPQSEAEIAAIAAAFPDVPLLFNYAEGGKTPAIDHATLARLGFAIVIFPISTMLAATRSMREVLVRIKQDGSPINVISELPTFNDFLDFIGLPEVRELERRYGTQGLDDREPPLGGVK
jgi:2-methylisocitrate lyase-like PEP mutase family enzyme